MATRRSAEDDAHWMGVALREARRGDPSPNPHVGAVLVKDGKLVATGYHRRAGAAHAEVAAIDSAGKKAKGATLYVTFEPCNHFGRTPPCTDAIIAAGIRRVVIGARDVAPHRPGALKHLRAAGVKIEHGVLRVEAEALVTDFFKHFVRGLPFVTLKAAITLDGRIATRSGESKWITGPEARREAHRLRAWNDAVLVGVGTVLADDPSLNVRGVKGRSPKRIVLDSLLRTPVRARVLRAEGGTTYLLHGPKASAARRKALQRAGAELVEVPERAGELSLSKVVRHLAKLDIVRLLVEGGAKVHGSFLGAGLVDRVALFVAPTILGDAMATPLAAGPPVAHLRDAFALERATVKQLGVDLLIEGELRGSRGR